MTCIQTAPDSEKVWIFSQDREHHPFEHLVILVRSNLVIMTFARTSPNSWSHVPTICFRFLGFFLWNSSWLNYQTCMSADADWVASGWSYKEDRRGTGTKRRNTTVTIYRIIASVRFIHCAVNQFPHSFEIYSWRYWLVKVCVCGCLAISSDLLWENNVPLL